MVIDELKKKQEVLFLSRTLGRAGVGVSLVSILKNIDYTRFNVTLGIQYPIKDLQEEIPSKVNVVYYGEIISKAYQKIFNFNAKLGKQKKNPIKRFLWHLLNKLEDFRMIYKVKKCFGKKFDTANAYHQGVASKYVMKYIHSKKKILWYHASVIEFSWYKKIFPKADIIIANTEKGKKVMMEEWGQQLSSKIAVIPCLIPFNDIIKKGNNIKEICVRKQKKYFLLTCGRLTPEKGMELAIEAAKVIKDITNDFLWLIIGDGPLKQDLQEKVKQLNLSENVKFLGFSENPYPFFKLCDIYVSPSRLESYGLTIVEALVFGKPVVTTKTMGGMTTIKDEYNGLYVDIDANSIAQAIIRLLKDERLMLDIQQNIKNIDFVSAQNHHIEILNKLEACE